MADDSAKTAEGSELSKDVLAPAEAGEGPRENLVATAIKFLQNPKVRHSPLSQKKAFLENKGLTSDEIQLAVQRAGVSDESPGALLPAQPAQAFTNPALMPVHQPMPPPLPISPWTKTREVLTTAAIVAAVSYAVYNVFKTYIHPWLVGKNEADMRMQRLEQNVAQLQTTVAESNAQVVNTLRAIQESLTAPRDNRVQSSEVSLRQETHALNEIKSEVSSLKALLLNRRQFPPPPMTSPIVPAWQKSAVLSSAAVPSFPTTPQEGASAEREATESDTQLSEAQPVQAQTDLESQPTQSAEELALLPDNSGESIAQQMAPTPEGSATAVSTSSSNNGFELVKPSSDSDTAVYLD